MQTLPTNSTTILTGQENKTRRNLRRLDRAADGRLAERILRLRVHGTRDQGRPDWTGADLIAADSFTNQLVRETAGQGRDGAFGACVVEEVGAADEGVDGAVVYDCVACFQVGDGVFGEVEVGVDICVEG